MTTERQRLFAVAQALGHDRPEVWEDRDGRFFATCSCGFESVYRPTFVIALETGIRHALDEAKPVLARIRRSGKPAGLVIEEARRRAVVKPNRTYAHPRERFKRAA